MTEENNLEKQPTLSEKFSKWVSEESCTIQEQMQIAVNVLNELGKSLDANGDEEFSHEDIEIGLTEGGISALKVLERSFVNPWVPEPKPMELDSETEKLFETPAWSLNDPSLGG